MKNVLFLVLLFSVITIVSARPRHKVFTYDDIVYNIDSRYYYHDSVNVAYRKLINYWLAMNHYRLISSHRIYHDDGTYDVIIYYE